MSVSFGAVKMDSGLRPDLDTKPSISLPLEVEHAFSKYVRHVDADQDLAFEWDSCGSIYYVVSGWLALSKSLPNGQNQIVDFALPGDFLDITAADGVTATLGIQSITEASVAVIPNATWEMTLSNSSRLFHLFKNLSTARCARQAERMLRIGRGAAETRVAYALLELCARAGTVSNMDTAVLHHPLKQQMIGDFVGVSSVHVCRTMREMVQKGILVTAEPGIIRVLNMSALCELASVDWSDFKQRILPSSDDCAMDLKTQSA